MTASAYDRDSYLKKLETEVVATGDDGRPFVVLADTVFYPEGGGQPADRGRIGVADVVDVQRVNGEVRHYLVDPLEPGPVSVEIDWARRFDHMQQHTGQHLLTAVAEDLFGWSTTAFHLGEAVSDIELDTPELSPEKREALEEAVAAEVRAVRPVRASRVTHDAYLQMHVRSRGLPAGHTGDVRLVEIEGLDLNTCGGTHLRSTAELESIKLLRTESLRGGTRLVYVAGGRARRLLGAHHDRIAALRGALGASDDELLAAVEMRIDQLKGANRALRQTEGAYAAALGAGMAATAGPVVAEHWPDRDLPFLQSVAKAVCEGRPDVVCLFTAGDGEGSFLLTAGEAAPVEIPQLGPRVADILAGRGGGRGRSYQGRASRLDRRDEAVVLLSRAEA